MDLFSIEQMTALSQLIYQLKHKHSNITDRNIIGHDARKIDLGMFFD